MFRLDIVTVSLPGGGRCRVWRWVVVIVGVVFALVAVAAVVAALLVDGWVETRRRAARVRRPLSGGGGSPHPAAVSAEWMPPRGARRAHGPYVAPGPCWSCGYKAPVWRSVEIDGMHHRFCASCLAELRVTLDAGD